MMTLDQIVPFGRSLDEYRAMFGLSDPEFEQSIIGIGDGPASTNAELRARGKRIISIDPIYRFGPTEIERRFYAVLDGIIDQVKRSPEDWVWEYHRSPEALRAERIRVMNLFCSDFSRGRSEGRYLAGTLPDLPFTNGTFDLALCSHLLFLYSDHLSLDFHQQAIGETLRIAREIRIFPLVTLALNRSPYLQPCIDRLESAGYQAKIQRVPYELQKGGNEMLVIRR